MASSMYSGDRRWKRGTLTPIGKIVVPKPINLPSQRLENHGLDPSVEIVPKGTLSWGSKSSSASNAWGSSSLSPTGGGTGSPTHLSGRPSSGSGTRPSTASSDRIHEPIANTSGQNSRPSSASGALATNQTSLTSLRPRSAETRPGSSQLSRFAEPSEHSVAWNAAGTAEKLGVMPPKNDEFSLTSGDFPTLGSAKENSGKNADSQDQRLHGRPGSSSGGGTTKERIETSVAGDASVHANAKSGTVNSWKRDNPPYSDDGGRPGMEKWQGNSQPYPNASVPSQHYDAWHGAPLNNPQGGVWFRGPPGGPPGGPGGPPYGNPVAPGGFPMEPFPYYRPQIPAAGLANPQPVPPPVAGPRGHHPMNGDMYRPHMPDAYMRPGMPIRPGFYHGPVPFEGYYNPPMGYCSSNERDVPFMGMAAGPSVYNRYSGQNTPEPGNSHGRSTGHGPANQTLIAEKVESGHPQDTRGPYKVLLKQHDGWDGKNEEQRSEGSGGDQPRASSWENNWRPDHRNDGERDLRKPALGEEASSQTFDDQCTSASVPAQVKSHGSAGNMKPVDDISVKKLETEALGLSKTHPLPAGAKDSSLIQKIEGLNAKARASDGRSDGTSISSGDRQLNKFQGNPKAHQTETAAHASHVSGISGGDKRLDATAGVRTTMSRRSTQGMQGKGDYHGRGRLNTQEADRWQNKSSNADSPVIPSTHLETSNVEHAHHTSVEATEKPASYPHGRGEGESVPPDLDSNDSQAQRAKMRELARQRTRQLQEEEEERTRKQLAKAHAKLEELNRRTHAVEGSTQKLENASSAIQSKQEESQTSGETVIAGRRYGPTKSALGSKLNNVAEFNEGSATRFEESPISSSEQFLDAPKSSRREHVMMHEQSVPLQREDTGANSAHHNFSSQVHESNSSKPRRMGFKQKQTNPSEKISTEKFVSAATSINEALKNQSDAADQVTVSLGVAVNEVVLTGDSSLPVNSNANADSSGHARKKNNRNGKNKHKVEDASPVAALPSSASKENIANTSVDGGKPKAAKFELDPSSFQLPTISKGADQSTDQHSSLPNEEIHGRVNNQWKPQQSRRMPRNPPVNRSTERSHGSDAVVWAPVRSQSKTEVTDEASPKNVVEAVSVAVKSDHQVQNNSKNKRAEMERYVPKPVAKEMAQQGSSHQPLAATINQTASDETTVRADTGSQGVDSPQSAGVAVGKAGYATESMNGSSRQNKQGKAHGSWWQRVSTESTSVQGLQDGPTNASNLGQYVQKSNEHSQRPDMSSVKEQPNSFDEWDTSDGWGISNTSNTVEPGSVTVIKDQGVIARGKRHAFKGHKSMGNNHDLVQKKNHGGDADKIYAQSSVSEMSQTDLPAASKENRGIGERLVSHWQPKSQAFSASNQRGNRHNGGQTFGDEINRTSRKESSTQDGVLPPMHKDTSEIAGQHHRGQSNSKRSNADETPDLGQSEAKRERKPAPRGRPHSPNQGPINQVEPAPVGLDARHEQQMASGFRRSGHQNSRFGRGQESRGDWNYSGQDNSQHNPPANRERQRHNSHYEYQPVGPYNKSNNSEGPKDGTHQNTGARVRDRERGQSHSRRGGGNF
nr:protein MODIFIER OF SNC1 1 [Ziziphus jujuba var. spinosa]